MRGFTLIEVLMALTIFSLIVVIAYGALATSGDGFRMLKDVRDKLEQSGWIGRQLRADMDALAWPQAGSFSAAAPVYVRKPPVAMTHDNRGSSEFDQLWLLVAEPGQAGISEVHYYIDESKYHLIRESRLLWARNGVEPVRWDMGEAHSCSVEAMGLDGQWQPEWKSINPFVWPKALRIRISTQVDGSNSREWLLPLLYGRPL
ncbi:prepilin-type N-terminal cleavage/methylation domain-containing protein [Mariprofundus erugo]|uniref:PulJ/GspJ family protein n=1 Tax=Mariprofundus erugo TaxID=2528639 RepID=UPI0010FD25CC|nr:prepilin-type N-terminal cleavage/methylation domain-containing protein [Mariprofundus erugo]TLS74935.1 prepilin-type N-terminal cleavage/methylation domain-containing protein [Mariprofundus erugo]